MTNRFGDDPLRARLRQVSWQSWKALPHLELWQVVALSLNIEPTDSIRRALRSGRARPLLPSQFFDRLGYCKQALGRDGPIRPQGAPHDGKLRDPSCSVLLADVAAFLVLAEFTVPDEMRAMLPKVADEARDSAKPVHAVAVPEQPDTQAAPAVSASTSAGDDVWHLKKPIRDDGLASPIYRVLKAAHEANAPRPSARDVLETFRNTKPIEIARVLADACDYFDTKGNEGSADLENIRKRIDKMTAV